MHLKIYQSIETLPRSVNQLFKDNELNSLFLAKQWFELYEQYFLDPDKCQFFVVFNEQKQALLLILLHWEKQAKKLISVSNFYTAFYAPLIKRNLPKNILEQAYSLIIEQYFISNSIESWALKPLLSATENNKLLIQTLKKYHFIIDNSFFFGNWTVDVSNIQFHEYFSQRPSKLKNTIKRKIKKLEKTNGYKIHIYSKEEDIIKHIKEYEKIYQLSWKTDEASSEFIHEFILRYAQSGHTRLCIAEINGQTVASQFWLVHNNIALIYKLAYDPDYKSYSIGSILTSKIMEHVIDIDGVKKIDYLSGDDPYKKDWMNQRQELNTIIAYNSRTFHGLFRGMLYIVKTMLKKSLKFLHLYPIKEFHV